MASQWQAVINRSLYLVKPASSKGAVLCLMGPTASGKTGLALELAQRLPLEIISVDSALVYRGMDIGTAKPSAAELAAAAHHLIDIRDAADSYSAGDFCRDVERLIPEILSKGKLPLLVGGTMLYFRALHSLDQLPHADQDIRNALQQELDASGAQAMHRRLAARDAAAAEKLNPNDKQRVLRALELLALYPELDLGQIYAQSATRAFPYKAINIALTPERALLHKRIEQRLAAMFRAGFVDEVRGFYDRGDLDLDMPSMRAVGYRQVWEHFQGKYSEQEMRDRALYATRQLAKRQITWLRKESFDNVELTADGKVSHSEVERLTLLSQKILEES